MTSSDTPIPLFHIAAFARTPFTGNPAAVVLLNAERETRWMQSVAEEMNLSETAFVYPDNGELRLRWMTPTVEVDLCGHATLAAASVLKTLAAENRLPAEIEPFWKNGCVKFISRSGLLTAESSPTVSRLISRQHLSNPSSLLPIFGSPRGRVQRTRLLRQEFVRLLRACDIRGCGSSTDSEHGTTRKDGFARNHRDVHR